MCDKELPIDNFECEDCNKKLEYKIEPSIVPSIILSFISIALGIFIVWDIIFMDFSGTVIRICEIDYNRVYRTAQECIAPTYNENEKRELTYELEIISDKTGLRERIDFNKYPILFNKENYTRIFPKLKSGDHINKSYFSPYYIINNKTYVLIGSPLQIILLSIIFLLLIPIILPKFIKDLIRDNKHFSKLKLN